MTGTRGRGSRRTALLVAATAACTFVACTLASPASAATWYFEDLDGTGGTNGRTTHLVGRYNAAVVWNREPHVWYHDGSVDDLRHAWWNGTAWFFETLDGAGGTNGRIDAQVGTDNAVTVWNGEPHVWYHDKSNGNLRHGWWNGATWNFETLDGAGGPDGRIDTDVGTNVAATVWNGEPHVWYLDLTNGNLRHAWWNGAAWFFETLDGAGGANGRIPGYVGAYAAVTVWNREPHVWYVDGTGGNLRHAWWNGTAWFFETLDGAGGPNGRIDASVGSENAATVWNREPHVWYRDITDGDLRHAWWTGTVWNFETLDGASTVGGRIDGFVGWFNAVVVWNREPHVFYWNFDELDLRHAWYG